MASCSSLSLPPYSTSPHTLAPSNPPSLRFPSPSPHPSPTLCLRCSPQPHRASSSSSSSSSSYSTTPFLANKLSGSHLKTAACCRKTQIVSVVAEVSQIREPLKVMISGAPASGKGTQCELIVRKHGLVHISAGDLLRAEVAAGTENGRRAKECMTKGQLVPNEIVVNMVKERLAQSDVEENGWLLDGYPRSLSQAQAIEALGIRPDVFIVLDVPDEVLIERVMGRRLDPVTGKIYHLKYSPPENEEIAARLTQRFDDTEPQAKLRLQTHSQNVDAMLSIYKNVIRKIDGNRPKAVVFQDIDKLLTNLLEEEPQEVSASVGASGC